MIMKKLLAIILGLVLTLSMAWQVSAATLTPYTEETAESGFLCGATFVLEKPLDYEQWLATELQKARDIYHLNTITVYGLEDYDDAYKTALFTQLERLDMKVCIRIESYDAEKFAFTADDAAEVMRRYQNLVEFTSREEYRDRVYYYALNMPVDDPAVQENLGGVNSDLSKANQVAYAEEIVRLMRKCTAENGFTDAKMYLSVFYGWDGTYEVPSYASSGADGYFINNYSYPKGKNLPGADADPKDILNTSRLESIMQLYLEDYPDAPNLVIECGFHTLEYNNGQWPGQTAGLVLDKATKSVAMKAIVEFYRENYDFVEGLLYFGYNLFKEEGNPPTVMDWALQYPVEGYSEAENAGYPAGAMIAEEDASEGGAVILQQGEKISFVDCAMSQQAVLFYRAEKAVTLSLSSGGQVKKQITLPARETYGSYGFPMVLVDGYNLEIIPEDGSVVLDKLLLLSQLEAEYALCDGKMQILQEQSASMEQAAEKIVGADNALVFTGVRGGDTLNVTYRASKKTQLQIKINGNSFGVALPPAREWKTVSLNAEIPKDAELEIYEETDCGLVLDCLTLSGVPATAQQIGVEEPKGSLTPVIIGASVAVLAAAAGLVLVLRKKKV